MTLRDEMRPTEHINVFSKLSGCGLATDEPLDVCLFSIRATVDVPLISDEKLDTALDSTNGNMKRRSTGDSLVGLHEPSVLKH